MKTTTLSWLSKSKLKSNLGCELLGWQDIYTPKDKVWDASMESRFVQGRQVEQIARDMFVGGVLQDAVKNEDKIAQTLELLKTAPTIFEASFSYNKTIVQFDMLTKLADGSYKATEIKSSTSFKDDYQTDVIIQYWISQLGSDVKISQFELWVVNTKSTSKDDYFTKIDVTELVQSSRERFDDILMRGEATRLLKEAPVVAVGPHCDKLECPFRAKCMKTMGNTPDSVFNLPNFNAKPAWDAYNKGITSVMDERFDQTYKYGENYPHVLTSIRENKLVIDQAGINAEFSKWNFPLRFFDFETLQLAVPMLDSQRPYEQVVIQFSCHTQNAPGDKQLKHTDFLHTDLSNPSLSAVKAIIEALGTTGSIVSYNSTFEKTCIRNLAKTHPEYATELLAIVDRFVDLLPVVKAYVYAPGFMGSYSLKSVSPTLLTKQFGGYSDSLISNGGEIAKYFVEMVQSSDQSRKDVIHSALLKYCKYDTINLALIMAFLIDQSADIPELIRINIPA